MGTTVLVEYIGRKPVCTDAVAGTGAVWHGAGDVREVPAEAWAKLAAHPTVWREARAAGDAKTGEELGASLLGQVQSATAGDAAGGLLIDSAKQAPSMDVLHGSDVHTAQYEIGGVTHSLGDIVRGAFEESRLSVAEWNALAPEDRHDFIDAHLAMLDHAAIQAAQKAEARAPKAKSIDLSALDRDALHALAKERGLRFHPNTGADKLRAALGA